ncbi:MAG: pitrilysin family protein [bacterium]|nr:pitrilysin family protein [bacterium]
MKSQFFKLSLPTLLCLLMGFGMVQAQSSQSQDVVPAYQPPAAKILAPVVLPPIVEMKLKNGMKVVVVQHHELPELTLHLFFRTGSLYDPTGKAGLTEFMANLLTLGTKNLGAKQIADKIDFVGGNISAGSSWDGTFVECGVLTKHLQTAIDLTQDVVLNPSFPEDEIERLREQTLSGIENSKDDPGSLAGKEFNKQIFANHPYALPTGGTAESVASFTREDILKQYQKVVSPDQALFYVIGDIDGKAGFKLAQKMFGDWKGSTLSRKEFPIPPQPVGYKIVLVNKPDATQAQIRCGYPGIARDNPDYFAINMMNYILGGGGFVSRLTKVIRAEKGLTYGIGSSFSARLQPGPFTVNTFTKNESALEAIQEIIKVIEQYQAEGPTDQELKEAKSYMTGSYPLNFETPNQIAGNLQALEIYNLGSDYIQKYRSRVDAVSKDEVIKAAQKYLHPKDMVFVVVAKAADVKEALEKIAPVQVIEIE